MMYRVRQGLGDSAAVDCSSFFTWPPNIFNPVCYPVTWAKLFGTPEQKAAAYGTTSPDVMYPALPGPAVPAAPTPEQVATIPPEQLPSVLADQAASTTQQQASDYFNQVGAGITAAGDTSVAFNGFGAAALVALGLGVGILLLASSGGRRR